MTFRGQIYLDIKKEPINIGSFSVYGGERGIWTHDRALALYMISNHAPSAARTALHGLHIVSLFSSWCPRDEHPMCKYGRGDRIRTCDLLVPNQARYQTALRPVNRLLYNTIFPPKVNEFFTTFLKNSNFFCFSAKYSSSMPYSSSQRLV